MSRTAPAGRTKVVLTKGDELAEYGITVYFVTESELALLSSPFSWLRRRRVAQTIRDSSAR